MNIVIVFAIPCYMATFARSAPVQERSALEDPRFLLAVQSSESLTRKVLASIPSVLNFYVKNPTDLDKLSYMAHVIGIPSAPRPEVMSENFSLETCLTSMSEGLRLHRALLETISPKLEVQDLVIKLEAEIRDLDTQIDKMLEMEQGEARVQWTPTPVALNLTGDFNVMVAIQLTLVRLQSFGNIMVECLEALEMEGSRLQGATL